MIKTILYFLILLPGFLIFLFAKKLNTNHQKSFWAVSGLMWVPPVWLVRLFGLFWILVTFLVYLDNI